MDCLFCKIGAGEIPSKKIYEDEKILAFYVIPKEHISCANEITAENSDIIAHIFETIAKIAGELNLSGGYRIVNNCGEDGGQTVGHLHFHVLAGRQLAWPPG